jgi:hypothetical protein
VAPQHRRDVRHDHRAGGFLPYRRFVLSIPQIHVEAGGEAMTYEQGIVYELRGQKVTRSLGYKDVATALTTMARLLDGNL